MAQLSYREAVSRGIAQEMARDERVMLIGEDIGGAGGVFKTTGGLSEQFGRTRVVDTPISEQAILGAAMGAAMTGLRPIAEIMFADFFAVCWDIVVNEIAKMRYMTNGQVTMPLVIKSGNGGSLRMGAQHSQSVENWAMAVPGLKVVTPSTPLDVVGLMAAAVRSDDPVLFFEHKGLYRRLRGEAPATDARTPIGRARVVREGSDATVITYGSGVQLALGLDHDVEVLDLRTLWPLDREAILESVARTSRALILQEAPRAGGVAGHVMSLLAQDGFELLDAPPVLHAPPDTPVPFAPELEDAYLPSAASLRAAMEELLAY
jgi:pyruvate dehydrogenase E1 component beta subunit